LLMTEKKLWLPFLVLQVSICYGQIKLLRKKVYVFLKNCNGKGSLFINGTAVITVEVTTQN